MKHIEVIKEEKKTEKIKEETKRTISD